MTTQVLNTLPAMGLDYVKPTPVTAAASKAAAPSTWRRGGTVQAFIGLCWVVGISASFLVVGIVGMFAADVPAYSLKTLEDLVNQQDEPMIETSMAELQALAAAEEQAAEEEPVELPTEIPQVMETPPQTQDLPELVEALTTQDVFAIPSAPKIEQALSPVEPIVRKVAQQPRPRTATTKSTGGGAPGGVPGGVAGATGGTGSGVGTGKGKFPAPPYPSFARSSGMQGTVRLSISVGPSGAVEGVTVSSSTGYSALDSYAVSWVRRNWRWPGGAASRYTLPLTFRLR